MTDAVAKPKARATRKKAAPAVEGASDIIAALHWINVAQKDADAAPVYQTHSLFVNGWLVATDGVMTIGHKVGIDGWFGTHTARLLAALTKSGDGLSISYDGSSLAIINKTFKVSVPCIPGAQINLTPPDAVQGPLTDAFGEALKAVMPATKLSGDSVLEASVRVTPQGTVMATDRNFFLEAYHGCATPEIILPRVTANVMRTKEGLTGAGMNAQMDRVTFWYGEDKFIATQLYATDTWPPNADTIFQGATSGVPLAKGLLEAVNAVAPHSPNGVVHLYPKEVTSHYGATVREAQHDIKTGVPACRSFVVKTLVKGLKVAESIDFTPEDRVFIFAGTTLRGAISTYNTDAPVEGSGDDTIDADIPF